MTFVGDSLVSNTIHNYVFLLAEIFYYFDSFINWHIEARP